MENIDEKSGNMQCVLHEAGISAQRRELAKTHPLPVNNTASLSLRDASTFYDALVARAQDVRLTMLNVWSANETNDGHEQ